MGGVFLLSLTAALNPTLLTATSVMLLVPNRRLLLAGYWLGAMTTSVTLGLVIVFALEGSSAVSTTKNTVSPLVDIALGSILVALALVLRSGRDKGLRERRARRKEGKPPPRWLRTLQGASPRTAFVIGALLTLPGASYLAGLARLSKLDHAAPVDVLVVVAFNLVMLILLELPLLASVLYPERAEAAVERVKARIALHGRRYAVRGLAVVGGLLVIKGVIGLL